MILRAQESTIPVDNVFRFSTVVVASNVRIVVTGVDSSNADSSPIGING